VPFIHVILTDLEAERLEHANAADAEYDLLLESIALVATVKVVG